MLRYLRQRSGRGDTAEVFGLVQHGLFGRFKDTVEASQNHKRLNNAAALVRVVGASQQVSDSPYQSAMIVDDSLIVGNGH